MRSLPDCLRRVAALALAVTLAAACATRPPAPPPAPAPVAEKAPEPPPPPPLPPPPDPVAEAARIVMGYQERLRGLANGELERERASLAEAPQQPANVVKLAMVMQRLRLPGDTARALALVEPLARSEDPAFAPWRPWLRLLAASLAEQRRLEEQLERQAQVLRENQRRIEQANQKIEALKAIERSLEERMLPSAPPAATARERSP
jgi:hypothetical protein